MADCTFVLNGEPLSELKCGTKAAQFESLRAILKGSLLRPIPGAHLKAYGKLTVV